MTRFDQVGVGHSGFFELFLLIKLIGPIECRGHIASQPRS
jgi:hypothetical protein